MGEDARVTTLPPPAPQPPLPPAVPAEVARSRYVRALIALAVVVVVAVALTAWALTRGTGEAGARATVEHLIDAVTADDCARVRDLTTKAYFADSFGSCDAVSEAATVMDGVTWEVTAAEVDAGTARVTVTTTIADGDETWTQQGAFLLTERGGDWLVSGEDY